MPTDNVTHTAQTGANYDPTAKQKAEARAEKERKRNSTNPADWGRWRQMVETYKITAKDDKHLVWSEVTFSHLWENIKNGSKVAVVVADVPSHTNVRVLGSVTIHEGDDFAKEYAAKVGKKTDTAVVVEVEEIFA